MQHFSRRRMFAAALILLVTIITRALWLSQNSNTVGPTLVTSTPARAAYRYTVSNDQSALDVRVDSGIGPVDGNFDMAGGTLELVPDEGGWRLVVNFTLDAASLDVGNAIMNDTLRRAMGVETYPTGLFIAQSPGLLTERTGSHPVELAGQLELHGIVQDYRIPAQVTISDETINLTAQFVITASQFDMNIPSLLASDELDAELDITALAAP